MYGRIAGTLAAALTQAAALLTTEKLGQVAGVGLSMAQKWINPQTDHAPNMMQCLLIDQACMKEAQQAPIHAFYYQEIGQPKMVAPPLENLQGEMLEVMSATGLLAAHVKSAMEKTSPMGEALSHNEAVVITQQAQSVVREAQDIILTAKGFVRAVH